MIRQARLNEKLKHADEKVLLEREDTFTKLQALETSWNETKDELAQSKQREEALTSEKTSLEQSLSSQGSEYQDKLAKLVIHLIADSLTRSTSVCQSAPSLGVWDSRDEPYHGDLQLFLCEAVYPCSSYLLIVTHYIYYFLCKTKLFCE